MDVHQVFKAHGGQVGLLRQLHLGLLCDDAVGYAEQHQPAPDEFYPSVHGCELDKSSDAARFNLGAAWTESAPPRNECSTSSKQERPLIVNCLFFNYLEDKEELIKEVAELESSKTALECRIELQLP